MTLRVPRTFPVDQYCLGNRLRITDPGQTGDDDYDFDATLIQIKTEASSFFLTLGDVTSRGDTLVRETDTIFLSPREVRLVSGYAPVRA